MSDASIPLSETTRDRLREAKGDQTYDAYIKQLLASHDGDGTESSCDCDPDDIAGRVERRVMESLRRELR